MGVPELTLGSYAAGRPLAMLGMDQMGLMTTHSYEFVTTDSAASATALATGHKTQFEGLSVKPGTTRANEEDPKQHFETVVEKAEKAGWRTGLVATSRIVHATPAAFAAHRANRHSYEDIALDEFNSGVDVLLGGGPSFFNKRADGKDLLAGFRKKGYKVALDKKHIDQASQLTGKLVGLPHDPDFPAAGEPSRKMTLAQMTRDALRALDHDNDKGFFLMVEGSQIDWRGHELDGAGMVDELSDFDGAIRVALDYARGRDDTLVVVTADHETGGMAVLDPADVAPLEQALGGHKKVEAATDWPDGTDAKAAERVARVTWGAGTKATLGPKYAEDHTLDTVFGHLSVASRAACTTPDEFSGMHNPSFIPVFAQGKAARYITQSDDNAELGRRIKRLVGPESVVGLQPVRPGASHQARQKPQNVILMVGDGMGIGALTAAYYAHGPLAMRSLPVKGLAATYAADRLVGDAASGATALATGKVGDVGALGMGRTAEGLEPARTLLESAEARQMATGLVTTSALTDPSAAAFYAHAARGASASTLAGAFVAMPKKIAGSDGIDLAFGAGTKAFGAKPRAALEARKVSVQTTWDDTLPNGQVVRLLGARSAGSAAHGDDKKAAPSLSQMTRAALGRLAGASSAGFVLVVDAGGIGRAEAGLARDQRLVDEVDDFDQAVAVARDFAHSDGNTLLVVTGDYDATTSVIDHHYDFDNCSCAAAVRCGGSFELTNLRAAVDRVEHNEGLTDRALQGKYAPLDISIQYGWLAQVGAPRAGVDAPRSANFVPLFADGPGSTALRGFHDLAAVGRVLQYAVRGASSAAK